MMRISLVSLRGRGQDSHIIPYQNRGMPLLLMCSEVGYLNVNLRQDKQADTLQLVFSL